MKDQINASKILYSSVIYIQSMKITSSLYKKLLMIKSVNFFLHLVLRHHIGTSTVHY